MAEESRTSLTRSEDRGHWHAWWHSAPDGISTKAPASIRVHSRTEELLEELAKNPFEPVVFHASTDAATAEALLQEARERGWRSWWAAPSDWLQKNRMTRQIHGPAWEIASWPEFWIEPWSSVGRVRPLPAEQLEVAYRLASDAIPVAVGVVWEGSLVAVNRSFGQLMALSPEAICGQSFARLWVNPRESLELIGMMEREGGRSREVSIETRWKRLGGDELRVDLRCQPVEDERLRGAWVVVATDVSRHHRAREFLELQRSLVECAEDGFVIVDVNPERGPSLIFANAAWERITGYSQEEVLGRNPNFLQRDDRGQSGVLALRTAIERGEKANVTLRNYRRDGTLFYSDVSIFPLPGQPGRPLRYVGIKRDVTQKMETQLRLKESESRFRHLFTDNRLPIILLGANDGVIVDANPAAVEFYGYTRDQLKALHSSDLLAGDGGATVLAHRRNHSQNPFELAHCTQRHRLADGRVRDVLVYSGGLQMGAGRMRYAIYVDVTAQRQAEARLRTAMEQARAANEAKSEFLQVVGHEIRTPMNAIAGFAMLLESAETEAERAESVEMVLRGTQQLTSVLDSVIEYIAWNTNLSVSEDVEVSITEFGEHCLNDWAPHAAAKNLELKLETGTDERNVWMPAADYGRIVGFLLDNAIKFTESGWVALDCHIDAAESCMVVRVTDTGIGIGPEMEGKLFAPFSSGDEGTRRHHGGIGMGLARCHRMVQAHGGSVSAQSVPGEGSTFLVRLPFRTTPITQ